VESRATAGLALTAPLKTLPKALELAPTDITVYSRRANAYYSNGKYAEAISDYNRVLEVYAFSYGFKIRGLAYLKAQNPYLALKDINKSIEMDSRDPETYFNRGLIYSSTSRNENAIRDFDNTLSLNPHNWEAFLYRGKAHFNVANYTQAMDDFDRVLLSALQSKKGAVHAFSVLKPIRNPAERQSVKDGYDKAIKFYSHRLDSDSHNVQAYYNRGPAYFYQALEHSRSLADADSTRRTTLRTRFETSIKR
jgi:tetratricopeptide (TPR) repeat protein